MREVITGLQALLVVVNSVCKTLDPAAILVYGKRRGVNLEEGAPIN